MIKGSNFTLRTIQEKDLPLLLIHLNTIKNRGDFYPLSLTTEADIKKRYAENLFWQPNDGHLFIANEEDDIIGDFHFYKTAHYFDGFELGWIMFDEKYRGKGIMSEALHLGINFLFSSKNIGRLQAAIFAKNLPSQKVAKKMGFKLEGTARQAIFHQGRLQDINIYSLLRKEFEAIKGK